MTSVTGRDSCPTPGSATPSTPWSGRSWPRSRTCVSTRSRLRRPRPPRSGVVTGKVRIVGGHHQPVRALSDVCRSGSGWFRVVPRGGLCPRCVRLRAAVAGSESKEQRVAGLLCKPSDGLEPSTPPWHGGARPPPFDRNGSLSTVQDLVPLQDAVQTVAGDVAALQALAHKALQTRHFRRERTAGSHPGGRRFESG